MALTDAKAKTATVPEGMKQTKLADGGGLYLFSSNLVKTTVFRR